MKKKRLNPKYCLNCGSAHWKPSGFCSRACAEWAKKYWADKIKKRYNL